MRVFAGIAAAAILAAACGGPAAVSTPTPTASPTPTPVPTVANVFKAELKSSNEVPAITDAEAGCAGTATVTLNPTSVKFDVTITGCPATTVINIGPPAWDAALITAIMANPAGYYVNFHSGVHGGGVIRGQLTKA